jgi:hypothetical protein
MECEEGDEDGDEKMKLIADAPEPRMVRPLDSARHAKCIWQEAMQQAMKTLPPRDPMRTLDGR